MYLPIKDVGRLTCAEYNGVHPIILTGAMPFVSERDVKFQYEPNSARSSSENTGCVIQDVL